MERRESNLRLDLGRSASAAVFVPIVGLIGGLIVGVMSSRGAGLTDLAMLSRVIKWSVTGFFTGLGLVLLLAVPLCRRDVISVRRLMVLVVVAALVAWYVSRVLFGVIGQEGT
ncbi:MAG: hypothetical protein ACYC61_15130 [Isosphaeraceae bacterium]